MKTDAGRHIVVSCLISIVVLPNTQLVFGSGANGVADSLGSAHRISQMSPTQKARLVEKQKKFDSLSAKERDRLRQLHRDLEQLPDTSELKGVMYRYADWLRALPPDLRAELIDLSPKERIDRVIELKADPPLFSESQVASKIETLPKDMKKIMRWSKTFVETYESKIVSSLPRDRQRRLDSIDPAIRRQMVLLVLLRRTQQGAFDNNSKIFEKELANLRSSLSPKAQKMMASQPPSKQWQIVSSLVGRRLMQRSPNRLRSQNTRQIIPEELLYFFEHKLSDAERERLLRLPGVQMQEKLRQLYLQKTGPPAQSPVRRGKLRGSHFRRGIND